MTEKLSAQFKYGADWIRADFHMHTIKDYGPSRKSFRDEFRDRENDFPKAFVAKLKEENIRVGVITNHNSFDLGEYKCLAKLAKDEILLLPGIELGIRGGGATIHTLVVFDPENLRPDTNFIENFLKGQFPREGTSEGSATEDDLAGCLKKLEGLGVPYFLVFAHVESDNGLLQVCKKTELDPVFKQTRKIWNSRVLGFQGCKSEIQWIKDKLPDGMKIPAFVEGSDPESAISEVGRKERGVCYLKVSDLSFESVQFALKDHTLRSRRDPPEQMRRPIIDNIEITGGKLGYSATRFSPELNTLIGSRGSGKSLVIEALRWCLGREPGKGDVAYKKELIDAFLQKGASVKVTGKNEHGDTVVISRAYTEKTNPAPPLISVNGKSSNITVDSVFRGLLYFGQKDLAERQEDFYNQFFSQVLGAYPQPLEDKAQQTFVRFEKSISDFQTAIKAKSEDDELLYEQNSLQKQLDVFKEHGVEERLKQITAFDQDIRRFRKFAQTYQEMLESLQSSAEEWAKVSFESVLFKSETNQELVSELRVLQTDHQGQLTKFQSNLSSFEAIETKLSAMGQKLETKRQGLQEQFAGILREIDVPDLNIDEFRKKVSRFEQLSEIRKLTKEKGGRVQQLEQALNATGDAWIQAKREISEFYRQRIETVNASLPANLKINISFQGDKSDFRNFLEGIFRGSRFDTTSYDRLLEACDNGLDLFKRRQQIKESELSNRMGEIFEEKMQARFKDLLTFSPKDARFIRFDDVSINELSLGKRAMALLLLLLSLKDHPIIILDQPEDDLDNETIHRLVVYPLVQKKGTSQFIIATHNPNVPVLGDAEQVIACHERTRGHFQQETGSLDFKPTKEAIIRIMEGGQEAFDKRHDIYTLWKNSNSEH